MSQHAYRAYNQTRVNSASPQQLLLMLYNAAIRHSTQGAQALDEGNTNRANVHLLKAQDILAELMASLDLEVELAHNLFQLYDFCHRQLVEANVSKSSKGVPEVVQMLTELRDAWEQALNQQSQVPSDSTVTPGRSAQGGISLAH